jgi:hypothetical protein
LAVKATMVNSGISVVQGFRFSTASTEYASISG